MRKTTVLWISLLFVAALPLDTLSASEGWKESKVFPDIVFRTPDGIERKLSDYRGKVVVLNFWASWCGPCVREWPALEQSYRELQPEVAFIILNMYEPYGVGADWARKKGYTMPLCDSGYSPRESRRFKKALTHADGTFIDYNKYFIPSSYVIDKNGVIVKVWRKNRLTRASLRKIIRQVTAQSN